MSARGGNLLARARRAPAGFSVADLRQLYVMFGFEIRPGNHPIAKHPTFPYLRATLPNHRSFAKEYVRTAVKLIDEVLRLEQEENDDEQ